MAFDEDDGFASYDWDGDGHIGIDDEIFEQEVIFDEEGGHSEGCYIATCVYRSYDCPEVWTLRRFRDQILRASAPGRDFVRAYYAVSPELVKRFGGKRWFYSMWKFCLDFLVSTLRKCGISDSPYRDNRPR